MLHLDDFVNAHHQWSNKFTPTFSHPMKLRPVHSSQDPSTVPSAHRPHLLALEARMMFDGAGVVAAGEVLDPLDQVGDRVDPLAEAQATAEAASATQDRLAASLADVRTEPASTGNTQEIAFVDAGLSNVQALIAELDRSVEIVLLDPGRDGLAQMAETLAGRTAVDAVHILSHGNVGQIHLGTTLLTTDSIAGEHAQVLSKIRQSLSTQADLLLYGCDAAEGAEGLAFIEALSASTGADVAASTDRTGAADRGGDWALEAQVGEVDVLALAAQGWDGELVQTTINPTGGTLADGSDGLRIFVTDLGQIQVQYQGVKQTYSSGATDTSPSLFNGIFLAIGNTVVGPNTNPSSTSVDANWKSVGLQTLTGLGTTASPYVVTTQVYHDADASNTYNATTEFMVQIQTIYAAPAKYFTEQVTVYAPSSNTSTVKYYHTLDTFLAGGDNGPAFSINSDLAINNNTSGDPSFVGVRKGVGTVNESMVGFAEATGDRQFDRYYSAAYNGANLYTGGLNNGGDIVNTWDTNPATDNGLGVQFTLGAINTATTFNYHIAFDGDTQIDLDANNSSGATGNAFQNTFLAASGTPVAVVDADVLITNVIGDINDATITLSNPQTGDVLTVNNALLPAGISVEVLSPNKIRLTGVANEAAYQTALQQVMFYSSGSSATARSVSIALHNQLSSVPITATTTLNPLLAPTADLNSDTTPATVTGNLVVNTNFSDYADAPFGWTEGGTGAGTNAGLTGRYAFSSASTATLSMTGLTGLNTGPGLNGAGILNFDIGYLHSDTAQRTLQVSVGGTVYATVTTGGASGVAGTVTYLNGATNAAGNTTATTLAELATAADALTSVQIHLPGSVSASGTLTFTASAAADVFHLDNVTLRATSSVLVDGTAGNDFSTTYAEGAAGVAIVDTDATIRDGDSATMASAAVTLTNPQTSDRLLVSGSAAATGTVNGIAYVNSGTQITLTGAATKADYTAALTAITFHNTSDNPNTSVVRDITVVVHDGTLSSSTAHSLVTLTAVNDTPTASNDSGSVTEDTTLSVNAASGLLANDADPEGSALSVTQFTVAGDATVHTAGSTASIPGVGSLTVNADGSYAFAPEVNYAGAVPVVTYSVSDGALTSTATLSLAITAVNDAPTASNDAGSVTEDTTLSVAAASGLLANDADPEGSPLSVTQFTIAGDATVHTPGSTASIAGVGSLTVNADGSYAFSPEANYTGAVPVVTYSVSDGALTSTSTLSLAIAAVNDAPVVADQTVSTQEDTPGSGQIAMEDADGEPPVATVDLLPAHGSVEVLPDGTYFYTPDPNHHGPDRFSIRSTDAAGQSTVAFVEVTVTPVNDAPQTQNDTVTLAEDGSAIVAVLANDLDPDGDPLALVAASAGHGTVVLLPDGTLQYTPDANFHGTDTIRYTVSDGQEHREALVEVQVAPVNDPPATVSPNPAEPTRMTAVDRSEVVLDMAPAFADEDSPVLTFSAEGLPQGLTMSVGGIISGVLPSDASSGGPAGDGRYTVTVVATDPDGASTHQVLVWTVDNTPPEAVADVVSTPADQPVTIAPLSNDADPDGDTLTLVSASAEHGTVTVHPDGTLTYQPGVTAANTDTVRYTVTDSQGAQRTAEIRITLTAVDAPPPVETVRTDTVHRQETVVPTTPSISATGAVLQSVSQMSSLGSVQSIETTGAVVASVNRIQSLQGTQSRDVQSGSIGVVAQSEAPRVHDRAASLMDSRQSGFDSRTTTSWTGASLQLVSGTGMRQTTFSIDTEVRPESVQVTVSNPTLGTRSSAVAEYQFKTLQGRPLPADIQADPLGHLSIHRVPGMEKVALLVRALHTDGSVSEDRVEVDVSTGTVRLLDSPERERQPLSPNALSTELSLISASPEQEREALAAALAQR